MTRKLLLALLFALVPAMVALPASAGKPAGGTPNRIVELDPGHGGTETGAVNAVNGTTLYEKDVNLAVALAAQSKLAAQGFTVHLTRSTDVNMSLRERVEKANGDGAGVMLSIHHNGSSDPSANFTTTYYTQKQDQRIASLAQANLVKQLGFRDGGLRHDGFTLTVRPRMPSALTEAWFITSDSVAQQYLENQQSFVDKEAQALADAVVAFFQ